MKTAQLKRRENKQKECQVEGKSEVGGKSVEMHFTPLHSTHCCTTVKWLKSLSRGGSAEEAAAIRIVFP